METEMSYGNDYHYLPVTSLESGAGQEVQPDLFSQTIQIVNVALVGDPGQGEWVLVDAGMPKSADAIIAACERRFGANSRPNGIVLTHGHFDHVGAIIELVRHWDVPVFAHELEMPYLTGKQSYSAPDPTVEGGMVAKMSMIFPIEPINLGQRVEKLPSDGTIPIMPQWRWIHTPGHTPGHISLFRESDSSLIAGDAFVTVKQDSLYKVVTQEQEINGPPRYLTPDWQAAWESVKKLQALSPAVAVTGHGLPITGELLSDGLQKLDDEFDQIAIPDYGK
ncbi:MBL fold metallo-hydrolase [Paenibacillus sp. J2TS4]|uniref:MBL fold metallo-hydrolase n=1 Tax=Paenibacillus sp. J2TS4 TaxID=2807194 RepID=UPI001AFDBFF4|nr:MBL fold metallo-hydrolase [Paenibacillus sp. J2TS4]GIP31812.1 MBL fold metallo-hydrolase [Paenibacillus sp. J2TS4]